MQVHNAELKNGTLVKEDFQSDGSGSAFETREDELVVLNVQEAGVAQLVEKVNQLVDGGFHCVVVNFNDVADIEGDELAVLGECHEVLARWQGWFGVCGLEDSALENVKAHGAGRYEVYGSVDSAVESAEHRPQEQISGEYDTAGLAPEDEADIPDSLLVSDAEDDDDESAEDILDAADVLQSGDVESLDELESIDELSAFESGDSELPSLGDSDDVPEIQDSHDTSLPQNSGIDDDAPLKLDWSQTDALMASGASYSLAEAQAHAELIRLDLAVEELVELESRIRLGQKRQGKHVLLTLNLGRRGVLAADDIEYLRAGQKLAQDKDGRFMLVSLPTEVKVWLRLKNYADEFETHADSKAAREALQSPAKATKAPEVSFEVTEYDEDSAIVEAKDGEGDDTELLTIVDISTGKLVGLDALIQRLGDEEVPEVVLESSPDVVIPDNSLDTLKEAFAKAAECGVIVSLIHFSGDISSLIKGFAGHVKTPDDLREAVLGAAQRRYTDAPFKTLEYGFERVALGLDQSDEFDDGQPILRADTTEFNRSEFGVAESIESDDLEDLVARRDIELAKLRAENAMLREDDSSGLGDKLAGLKEDLARVEDEKERAQAEISLMTGQVAELRQELDSERERSKSLDKAKDDIAEKGQAVEELGGEVEELKSQLEAMKSDLEESKSKLDDLETEKSELESQLEETKSKLESLSVERDELVSHKAASEEAEESATKQEIEDLRQQLADQDELKSKNSDLEAQIAELKQELEASPEATEDPELAGKLESAEAELKASVEKLEAAEAAQAEASESQAESDKKIARLERELTLAKEQSGDRKAGLIDLDALPEDVEELRFLLMQAEQDKLRILGDAEVEIERLARQEEMLREELESAGEMIERLGKELELS